MNIRPRHRRGNLIDPPRVLLLVIFLYFTILSPLPAALWAQELAEDAMPRENMDSILSTLNETLEENRSLRSELESLEQTFREITVENSVLKNQLEKLQEAGTEDTAEQKAKIAEVEKRVEELNQLEANLVRENQEYGEAKQRAETMLNQVREQNEELKKVLSRSILETERDEFFRLLREAERAAQSATSEIAAISLRNQSLRDELSSTAYSLGNMLFEKGDHKGAIAEYEKALELDPSDSWAHHNLGVIYDYYLNNHVKALEHYSKYLRFKPVQEEANEIRRRVLDLELSKEVVPKYPLKVDFSQYSKGRT